MVRWLDPDQLLDTTARVLASGLFTSYTDSRELQVHASGEVYERAESSEVWLDYVSDLGDGWNSTYTVARLLAQDDLELSDGDRRHRTRRGSILVMGGDEVYPVPTRTHYENRCLGPYRAAMPCAPRPRPDLFAHPWQPRLV